MTQIFTNMLQNVKNVRNMQFRTKYATKLKTVQICIYMPNKIFLFSSECLESTLNQSENRKNPIAKNMTCHRNPPLSNHYTK